MGAKQTGGQEGFTIIEVTMFLALSGLLMVLLLGGWSAMLNTQRYTDSNRTLQSFLQQQYNLVYNVENARGLDLDCQVTGGKVVIQDTIGGGAINTTRGQSDCILMGRFIRIDDGTKLAVKSIVGVERESDKTSDTDVIRDLDPVVVDQEVGLSDNELEIPWQAVVVGSKGDRTPQNLVIAIVRSPVSGIVHTYSNTFDGGNNPPLVDLTPGASNPGLIDTSFEKRRELCLDPGVPLAGGVRGIRIAVNASSQSGIKPIPNPEVECNAPA